MYNLDIVVGAGYGDEGKGRITSFLANEHDVDDTIVVMSTGSAQRGHTAWNKDMTIRHVFHHLGSATLDGYATYISDNYRINPLMFRKEYEELENIGITPTVYLNRYCYIVLPQHMIINQCVEELKAIDGRQDGSCGMGVYESIVRNVFRNGTLFNVKDFIDNINNLEDMICSSFTDGYLSGRIMAYEISLTSPEKLNKFQEYHDIYNDRNITKSFIDDFKFMLEHCVLVNSINDIKDRYHNFVFENSQGLGINRGTNTFENEYTPMHCGSYAVDGMISSFKDDEYHITINYVTRWYATKHGGCDVPYLDETLHFEDKTNVYNKWQTNMTFGNLDVGKMISRIMLDKRVFRDNTAMNYKTNLFITCFDQIEDFHKVKFIYDNKEEYGFNNLIQTISDEFSKMNIYTFLNEDNDSFVVLVNKRKHKNEKLEEHFYCGKKSFALSGVDFGNFFNYLDGINSFTTTSATSAINTSYYIPDTVSYTINAGNLYISNTTDSSGYITRYV